MATARQCPHASAHITLVVLLLAATSLVHAAPVANPTTIDQDASTTLSGSIEKHNRGRTWFSSLIHFGDSFTDTGNVYKMTNKTWPLPPPYNNHGRYANGLMWPEYLSSSLCAPGTKGVPVINFAHGGSTTNDSIIQGYTGAKGDIPSPGIDKQLDMFAAFLETSVKRNASLYTRPLFTFMSGFNDIYYDSLGNQLKATPQQLATNIMSAVATIDRLATQFKLERYDIALLGLPPAGRIPAFKRLPSAGAMFERLAAGMNTEVANRVAVANAQRHPQRRLTYVNLHAAFTAVMDNPAKFNYAPPARPSEYTTSDACVTTDVATKEIKICVDPAAHVWWDDYHPTTRTHRVAAQAIAAAFGERIGLLPRPKVGAEELEWVIADGPSNTIRP
ncbi:hypothetical protein BCR44DRAFT_34131 [Catenaria anguillulae PL171]|uniref:GDSL lipase/esterase n=1 Tax=Catenaria anguillulae PL171 TaxID=765915 RepID=A0A1Y2HUN9_9FUNG|nr:hypothetical protein BCR44DRAFT_34131 [Catenaria anguillulae PL171]